MIQPLAPFYVSAQRILTISMTDTALSRRRFLQFSGLAMASGLAGCTSSMNTDRFRYETRPYFRNPALEGRPEYIDGARPPIWRFVRAASAVLLITLLYVLASICAVLHHFSGKT